MKLHLDIRTAAFAIALPSIALLGPTPALAEYSLGWFAVSGSAAANLTGSNFTLRGTVGQPVAGTSSGGGYSMTGGFWVAGGGGYTVDVGDPEGQDAPLTFRLHPAAPNPLHDRTIVTFDLPRETEVSLRLYDVRGRLLRTLASGAVTPGRHQRAWDGVDEAGNRVPPGVYFVRLEAGATMRMQRKIVVVGP
ncbi:MAG: FlgD immunoglobulin-like domain containing protein [Candidatus Eiseniibacteriota bacterium]